MSNRYLCDSCDHLVMIDDHDWCLSSWCAVESDGIRAVKTIPTINRVVMHDDITDPTDLCRHYRKSDTNH